MRVSCIIPAYNEAATIAGVIQAVRCCPSVDEIIVVSDGSTDDTPACAQAAGADHVIDLSRNGGKGHAVFTALHRARGEVILLLDGDLCGLGSDHVSLLLAPLLGRQADMAVALFGDDRLHRLLRPLSGQRAVHRSLLAGIDRLERAGFGLEIALDRLARERRARLVRVTWHGVGHRSKQVKYGAVKGVRLKVRASSDMARQAGTLIRIRRGGRKRSVRTGVTVWMVLGLCLVMVIAPLFLLRPRHASAHLFPRLVPPGEEDRLLVVVAHPDDEAIGSGGLIAAARRAGAEVAVVVVTNGDSNRLSAAVLTHRVRPKAEQQLVEGRVRQQETLAALARLGVAHDRAIFFGFPDRALEQVLGSEAPVRSRYTGFDRVGSEGTRAPGTPYTRTALLDLMREVMAEVRPTMIVTHLPFDRHPDHRAVWEVVEEVREGVPVYGFLVHAPGFPRPLRMAVRDPLVPPTALAEVPGWTWMRFDLSPELARTKQDAVNAYRSQILTPYLRLLLASFIRTNELFASRDL